MTLQTGICRDGSAKMDRGKTREFWAAESK